MSVTRKCIGGLAAGLLIAGFSAGALADVTAKNNVKNPHGLEARAFFVQWRPTRHTNVTPVAVATTRSVEVRRTANWCYGCQPLIVTGVGF